MSTKTALLVVDMQNDFTKPGARAYYATTEKLMETFPEKINRMRQKGVQIVIIYSLVPDDHKPNPELTRITKSTRTLVEGTYGAEIDERIPYDPDKDWKMQKFAASAFLYTGLAERLKEAGIENVLVSGVKTNVCCRHTTVDSASYGFRTFLVDDMLATNTQELHAFHLREMGHQYATVVTSEEVLRMLDEGKL
ncbi:MAG: cysteine hydrolase family protein [Faecousia sp.]